MAMGRPTATKENRKGSARRYSHHQRKLLAIAAGLFVPVSVLVLAPRRLLLRTTSHETTTTTTNIGTISDRSVRSIDYGERSTPVVMIRSSLEEKLHARFLEEHLYSCSEGELNDIPELDNRVQLNLNPPVYVYEGYYHSLPTGERVYSKNPNPMIGKDFMKPAASPFTRAFYEAFRRVNREIFDKLKHDLFQASSVVRIRSNSNSTKGEKDGDVDVGNDDVDVCYLLGKWIEKGYHFGDLSVQVHYGRGNEQKLLSGAAWHTDAENSLLHLAVTLRGRRVLHSKRIITQQAQQQQQHAAASLRRPRKNDATTRVDVEPTEVLEEQTPGSVYLSSSTLMRHAPQFFDTDHSARAIAIHARILYTSADIRHFRRVRTKESWQTLTAVLAKTLAAAELRIPSLEQVESSLAQS